MLDVRVGPEEVLLRILCKGKEKREFAIHLHSRLHADTPCDGKGPATSANAQPLALLTTLIAPEWRANPRQMHNMVIIALWGGQRTGAVKRGRRSRPSR